MSRLFLAVFITIIILLVSAAALPLAFVLLQLVSSLVLRFVAFYHPMMAIPIGVTYYRCSIPLLRLPLCEMAAAGSFAANSAPPMTAAAGRRRGH